MKTNVRDLLNEMGFEDAVVFENPSYDSAIIGYDMVENRIVYDFNLMVQHRMDTDGMEYDEAVEFIENNTIIATSYAGAMAPIIVYNIKNEL